MSMLKICGQELELDLFDADVMDKFEKANNTVVKRAEECKKNPNLSGTEGIRTMCGVVNDFFDEVFGAGTSEKLFKEKCNLMVSMEAFATVANESSKMKGQVNNLLDKYNLNRAQRRQDTRNNKHGKIKECMQTPEEME